MPPERKLHVWWWHNEEDRRKFRRRLRRASPYIVILLMPGSFVLLPLYAMWRQWLKKRRRNSDETAVERLPD